MKKISCEIDELNKNTVTEKDRNDRYDCLGQVEFLNLTGYFLHQCLDILDTNVLGQLGIEGHVMRDQMRFQLSLSTNFFLNDWMPFISNDGYPIISYELSNEQKKILETRQEEVIAAGVVLLKKMKDTWKPTIIKIMPYMGFTTKKCNNPEEAYDHDRVREGIMNLKKQTNVIAPIIDWDDLNIHFASLETNLEETAKQCEECRLEQLDLIQDFSQHVLRKQLL